jgi:hypothetical protein
MLPAMNVVECRIHGLSHLCHVNVDGSHADVNWCTCQGNETSASCPVDTHNLHLRAGLLLKMGRTEEAEDVLLSIDREPELVALQMPLLSPSGVRIA